jgi:predicted adenine nucleotide alpha hydrolase (AANH) superfamily ATPase
MLLHSCCATCASYPVSLLGDSFNITLFYYNPNIYPEEEYCRRLEDIKKLANSTGIPLMTGEYDRAEWLSITKHLSGEPEGGKRCPLCFDLRLKKTALAANEEDFDIFGTTLTISPHKDSSAINDTGKHLAIETGIDFYISDLKKKDGFKKTVDLSRKHSFYRQNYCGCEYSIRSKSDQSC